MKEKNIKIVIEALKTSNVYLTAEGRQLIQKELRKEA